MGKATPSAKPDLRYWWVFLLTGILLILVGCLAFYHPVVTGIVIGLSLGIVVILLGIAHIAFALSNRHLPHWSWHLVMGFIDLLFGAVLLPYPDITVVVLPFLVGFWFLFRGISVVLYAFTLKHFATTGWGWFLGGGIFIAAFALFIIYFPSLGYLSIVAWTAIALIVTGISNILLALRLKNRKQDSEQTLIM
ncbi:MAG TPA: HdeD family acid-resistance protein [Puia sp.]|nr:HdeD family acid-resistance protein [Puia sp.]